MRMICLNCFEEFDLPDIMYSEDYYDGWDCCPYCGGDNNIDYYEYEDDTNDDKG